MDLPIEVVLAVLAALLIIQFFIIKYAVLGALQAFVRRLEKPRHGADHRTKAALVSILTRETDA